MCGSCSFCGGYFSFRRGEGLFWGWLWFPTMRAWGVLLPYTPSSDGVREGCDPLALSAEGEIFGDAGKERERIRGLFGGGLHVSGDMAYASSREGVRV